jgi:hypothetical protein
MTRVSEAENEIIETLILLNGVIYSFICGWNFLPFGLHLEYFYTEVRMLSGNYNGKVTRPLGIAI